jgi:hypothetical protein
MAFIHGKSAQVLHGAYDLTSYLNEATASQEVETAETTVFGNSAKTYIVGLKDGTVSASGMFDGAANAVDEVLAATVGSDSLAPVTVGYEGLALGKRVSLLMAKTTSYEVSSPVGDVVSVSYDAQADGGIDQGVSLASLASVSATTTGSSHDNSASSANGGIAQLHVTANTWSANTTLKVQHSADNSTWADLATFAVVATTVKTSERVIVAAGTTVNRYLRAVATLSAGTGAITYQISFARR